MSKPAYNSSHRQKNFPTPAPKYRASSHRPTPHSARPRLSGICEPLLAQNSCATSPKSVRALGDRQGAEAPRHALGCSRCRPPQDDDEGLSQIARQRKRVEMRFAHLKNHYGFERLRLRGLSGARDAFPSRSDCAEPQDPDSAPHPATAKARLRVSCVALVGGVCVRRTSA